jgi:hypothetical protein
MDTAYNVMGDQNLLILIGQINFAMEKQNGAKQR